MTSRTKLIWCIAFAGFAIAYARHEASVPPGATAPAQNTGEIMKEVVETSVPTPPPARMAAQASAHSAPPTTTDKPSEPPLTSVERDVVEQIKRLRQASTNVLKTDLRGALGRLKSNNPPTAAELAMLVEELRRREPENTDLEILDHAMDLNHAFARAPRELLANGERFFRDHPEHPLTSGLLVYGLMAQGFDHFRANIGQYVLRYPDNPDFQYAAAAVELANQTPAQAKQRLAYVLQQNPGMEKAAVALKRLAQGEIKVDAVMDFNPTFAPEALDRVIGTTSTQ